MVKPMSKLSHELIVQTARGNSHYKIAETDKLQDGIAEVTIIAGDSARHGHICSDLPGGGESGARRFAVYACRSSLEQIRFVGTFTREGVTWK